MKQRIFAGALSLVAMCAPTMLTACADAGNQTTNVAAAERAQVDILRDCDKPFYDKVSATDHKTVIRGMTPVEREVCLMNSPSLKSGMMGGGM